MLDESMMHVYIGYFGEYSRIHSVSNSQEREHQYKSVPTSGWFLASHAREPIFRP